MGDRLLSALIRRAADRSEHTVVRGECLERLSFSWSGPKNQIARKAHRAVIQCLKDPDPYVRFHACYAAAYLRMHRAIPLLERLTADQEPAAMGETVGFEAAEAIKELRSPGQGWQEGFKSGLPPAKSFENLHVDPYDQSKSAT